MAERGLVVKLLSHGFVPYEGKFQRMKAEADSLRGAGYEVSVLAWDRSCTHPTTETIDGIAVERVHIRSGYLRGPVRQMWPLCRFLVAAMLKLLKKPISVIHCHTLDVVPLAYLVARWKGARVIYDAHDPNEYALWPAKWHWFLAVVGWFERFVFARIDGVIVTTAYQQERCRRLGVRRTALLGNYPRLSAVLREPPKEKFRKGRVVVGRLGTIGFDVGIEESIAAFSRLVQAYPETRLLLAGYVLEPYRPTFDQLTRSLTRNAAVLGAFSLAEMPALYRQMDVSLLLYRKTAYLSEVTPTKFFDSLAYGVPVIMTDIGGLGDVVRQFECGIIVDESDADGVYRAAERLITDPDLRLTMARNGIELIRDRYNWDLMEATLAAFYRDATSGAK